MWTIFGVALAATSPEQAADALKTGDFATAAKAYRALVKKEPDNGLDWFQLASAEYGLGRWQPAADAWKKARELGARPALSAYDAACALAHLGRTDDALASLDAAVGYGRFSADQIRDDPDLASLVADPRFTALVEKADAAAHPCEHDPRYAAVDFWVGAFDVTDPSGQPIGTNTITREQHGCLLVERWTDAQGGTGTSFTFLDPGTQKWRQLWLDEAGTVSDYVGELDVPGHLVMEARTVRPGAPDARSRGTWTLQPDGTVRQVFDTLAADGSWTPVFDGTYTPATRAPSQP